MTRESQFILSLLVMYIFAQVWCRDLCHGAHVEVRTVVRSVLWFHLGSQGANPGNQSRLLTELSHQLYFYFSYLVFFFLKMGSPCITQAYLKLLILLPPSSSTNPACNKPDLEIIVIYNMKPICAPWNFNLWNMSHCWTAWFRCTECWILGCCGWQPGKAPHQTV